MKDLKVSRSQHLHIQQSRDGRYTDNLQGC